MHTRKFLSCGGASAACAGTPGAQANPAPKKALMKAATQHDSSDDVLPVLAAFVVTHVCSALPSTKPDEHWTVEGLTRLRERVEAHGVGYDGMIMPDHVPENRRRRRRPPGVRLRFRICTSSDPNGDPGSIISRSQ